MRLRLFSLTVGLHFSQCKSPGYFELFSSVRDPGSVCLGGNSAPGAGANYLVLVGPMVNMELMASHQVLSRQFRSKLSG